MPFVPNSPSVTQPEREYVYTFPHSPPPLQATIPMAHTTPLVMAYESVSPRPAPTIERTPHVDTEWCRCALCEWRWFEQWLATAPHDVPVLDPRLQR